MNRSEILALTQKSINKAHELCNLIEDSDELRKKLIEKARRLQDALIAVEEIATKLSQALTTKFEVTRKVNIS